MDFLSNIWVRLALAAAAIYLVYRLVLSYGAQATSPVRSDESVDADGYSIEDTSQPFQDRPAPFMQGGATEQAVTKYNDEILSYPQISNRFTEQSSFGATDLFNNQVLLPKDLLPRDSNAWNDASPQPQGSLSDQNFLASGHLYGINTVGQSLKNANTQLRSDPPIPQVATGPWLQSTIEADTNRRPFEIGGC